MMPCAKGIYPRAARQFRPWKNGGGETAEVVVSPPDAGFDDFDWRISTAIVAEDGPFSAFAGIDRVLTVIDGGAMRLDVAGQVHLLEPGSPPFAFAGDQPCAAALTAGPLLDFNVMVRRPLRATVTRGPLVLPLEGGGVHLALLLQSGGGLARLDLVDMRACDPAQLAALMGIDALLVRIEA